MSPSTTHPGHHAGIQAAWHPRPAPWKLLRADKPLVEITAFFVLLVIGVLDRISPPELSMEMFYLVPLGFVAWFGARGAQWRLALAAVVIWELLDSGTQLPREWWLQFWLVAEKVVMFGGMVWLATRLRQAIATQRQLADALAERVRVVEQLAAGVAHEVRNPLGTLLSGLEYLGRHERSETETLLVEDMHAAVQRAEVIVRDLNDFSAPLRLVREPVKLDCAVRQAAAEARLKADAAGIVLDVVPPMPQVIDADPTRLVQVLVNLMRNAIDASPRGSTVRIAVRSRGGRLCIDVEDQGTGIAPEQLERVFEPFFTTKAPGAGTGLGLSVSRRIVQDHGGELELANRPEGGLRASLILPLQGQHA